EAAAERRAAAGRSRQPALAGDAARDEEHAERTPHRDPLRELPGEPGPRRARVQCPRAGSRAMRRLAGGLLLLTLADIGAARAEDATDMGSLADKLALSGSLRTGYWSSDRKLDDIRNFTPTSVWLKAAPDLGNGFSARAEAWAYDERPLVGRTVDGEL